MLPLCWCVLVATEHMTVPSAALCPAMRASVHSDAVPPDAVQVHMLTLLWLRLAQFQQGAKVLRHLPLMIF